MKMGMEAKVAWLEAQNAALLERIISLEFVVDKIVTLSTNQFQTADTLEELIKRLHPVVAE